MSSRVDLLGSLVPDCHPLHDTISEKSEEDTANHAPDEGAGAEISNLCGIESPGGTGEDAGHDDGGTDVPGAQETRDDDDVKAARVAQGQEHAKEPLDNVVVREDAVVDFEFLDKGLLLVLAGRAGDRGRRFVEFLDGDGLLAVFLVGLVDLFERLGLKRVGLVDGFPEIGGFGAEEEHEDELDDQEDLEEVEQPEKTQVIVHLAADDRGQTGGRVEYKVDGRNPQASLVHAVQISNDRNDERLERAGGEALNDTSSQEVVVAGLDFTNGRADNTEERGNDEDGTFTIATTEGTNEGTDTTDSEDVITRDHDRRGEIFVDFFGNRKIGSIQEGTLWGCVSFLVIQIVGRAVVTLRTFVAAHNIDPKARIQMMDSFFTGDQLRGSFGSSLG